MRHGHAIQPVIADVKKRVIYPRHGVAPGGDLAKASRTVTGVAAGRRLRVIWRDRANWTVGTDFVLHHKGRETPPRFTRLIDIEVTGDPNRVLDEVLFNVTRLNERYRQYAGYLDSAGLIAVEAALRDLFAKVAERDDMGPVMHEEAVAYIGRMLDVRYAEALAREVIARAGGKGRDKMARVRLEFEKFLETWLMDPDWPPFFAVPCCTYWHLAEGGDNYIIGRYTTAKGTVVRYRSGPIDLFLPHMPGAGLALVKSGIGYHIYFEKHDGPTGTLATVYRLGETAERIFHARVSRWSCSDPTGDYGELHCT